jgi:hypothetical protein
MNWENLNMWLYGVVTALITGVMILVRKVFTNERQIDLLTQKLEMFEEDVGEMKSDIKELLKRE